VWAGRIFLYPGLPEGVAMIRKEGAIAHIEDNIPHQKGDFDEWLAPCDGFH
jgi:hypothetical protein